MDVSQRPEWLKSVESKVYKPKRRPSFSHAALPSTARGAEADAKEDEYSVGGDDDISSVLIDITPFPSTPQQSLSSPPLSSQPLDHMEHLKRRQEAQMEAMFEEQTRLAQQQTQIATQQALLLSQAAEEQAQRVAEDQQKKLLQQELERERDRLQALQHEQLMQTELVLEHQRHYLDTQGPQGALFADGCDVVQCTDTGMGSGGRSSASADTEGDPSRPPEKKKPGSMFAIFSTEI